MTNERAESAEGREARTPQVITDRQGKQFEVTRGIVPAGEFNLRPAVPALAARALARVGPAKCEHAALSEELSALGLPDVLVRTADGEQRVYSNRRGIVVTALERPTRAFYERQQAAAEATRDALEAQLAAVTAERDALQAEYDAADTLPAFKAFVSDGQQERLDAARKAVPELTLALARAVETYEENADSAAAFDTVAEGVCTCAVKREAQRRRAARDGGGRE